MYKNTKYACIFNKYAQNFTKYAQNGAFTNGTPYKSSCDVIKHLPTLTRKIFRVHERAKQV